MSMIVADIQITIHGLRVKDCTEIDKLVELIQKSCNTNYDVLLEVLHYGTEA